MRLNYFVKVILAARVDSVLEMIFEYHKNCPTCTPFQEWCRSSCQKWERTEDLEGDANIILVRQRNHPKIWTIRLPAFPCLWRSSS